MIKTLSIIAYPILLGALGIYIHDRNLYSDIDSWQSVPPLKLQVENPGYTYFTDSVAGRRVHRSNASSVLYSYRVDEKEYQGSAISPNGSNQLTAELNKPNFITSGSKEGAIKGILRRKKLS